MNEILNDFSKGLDRDIEKDTKSAARDSSKALKNVSPKDKGDYASGWSYKQIDKKTAVAYNRKQPGLTHLLEKSHVISNKYGEFGRSRPHVHIAPVAEQYVSEFIRKIQRDIES